MSNYPQYRHPIFGVPRTLDDLPPDVEAAFEDDAQLWENVLAMIHQRTPEIAPDDLRREVIRQVRHYA
ncbi:hypothetical protein [Patulibacter defluvii]|uniref:hypothetical protein n=1 Tax=Patulibacter defluvii TaxID=3095358 RepID=UPI002A74E06E|nr:hypothetical protein [Patulibacter sp. DM4]